MSVEIWLATGKRDEHVHKTHLGIPGVPYCNHMKHAVERCPCNYNTCKPGSRHTAHGPRTKKALSVLSEDFFSLCAMHIYDSR